MDNKQETGCKPCADGKKKEKILKPDFILNSKKEEKQEEYIKSLFNKTQKKDDSDVDGLQQFFDSKKFENQPKISSPDNFKKNNATVNFVSIKIDIGVAAMYAFFYILVIISDARIFQVHDDDMHEVILLIIYQIWALYIMLPLSIIKHDVRMITQNKQISYLTYIITATMIKIYPGYLILSRIPYTSGFTLFLLRIFFLDIIHFIVVYIIREMLLQIKFLKEEQNIHANSTVVEIKQLLEKMPEGILIMPEQKSYQCYMNQELSQVLNQLGLNKNGYCCPDDEMPTEHVPDNYQEEEAFEGLYRKIFKRYSQQQQENPTNSELVDRRKNDKKSKRQSMRSPAKSQEDELISLKEMLDSDFWNENEERFFEIVIPAKEENDEEGERHDEDRIFIQIRRLKVQYNQQPAKMIVIRDISLIIDFEKEKNENKYQELLTATMSHEMLTPLNSIINLSVYIEQKLSKRQQRDELNTVSDGSKGGSTDKVDIKQSLGYIHIIKSSANILQYLIKDLIDLMNLRLDRFNKNIVYFSPIDACNEVLTYFDIQSREKGLHLKRMISNESRNRLSKLAGDKQRFQQILLNIVANSVKFTYQGGVDVILEFKPNFAILESKQSLRSPKSMNIKDKSINTGCLDCGSLVTIVKDTGIGIPQSMTDRLFKIFGTVNRGEHTSLITTQGIGLGLTICKQLVEKLGGQINLYSVPNIGTEVIFSLPIKCINCSKQDQQSLPNRPYSSLTFQNMMKTDPNLINPVIRNNGVPAVGQIIDQQGSFTSINGALMLRNTTNMVVKRHQESNPDNISGVYYQHQHNLGKSQAEHEKRHFMKSQTFNFPMTPQASKSRLKRRPFGGDIQLPHQVYNKQQFSLPKYPNNAIINIEGQSESHNIPTGQNWRYVEFINSVKTELHNFHSQNNDPKIARANQSEEQKRAVLFSSNSNSIPNRSNALPLGSIMSKFQSRPQNIVTGDTVNMEGSLPNKKSNDDNKSRAGVSDSKNGAVVPSDFVNSSHYSIQDKLMKKSFATKVLHENNNLHFGQRVVTSIRKSNFYQQKPVYQQEKIHEEGENSLDKSQDIRLLLNKSSDLSINEEQQQNPSDIRPFNTNDKCLDGNTSSLNKSNQSPQNAPQRFSVGGLEPYNDIQIHQNNLQVVSQLNRNPADKTAHLLQMLPGEMPNEEPFIENDLDQYLSVATLQPQPLPHPQQPQNSQLLSINQGIRHKNYSSSLNSKNQIKQAISTDQLSVQQIGRDIENHSAGVGDKNQTGYFPTLQRTGQQKNNKKEVDETVLCCSDDIIVTIENNRRPSCGPIGGDQNSKSSTKRRDLMSSADITPQFNPLFKQPMINSGEGMLDNNIIDSNQNRNNLIQQRGDQANNQASLRDMLFLQKGPPATTEKVTSKQSSDTYQPIITFCNQIPAKVPLKHIERGKNCSTLFEEEEKDESKSNLPLLHQKANKQFENQEEESVNSTCRINLGALGTHQLIQNSAANQLVSFSPSAKIMNTVSPKRQGLVKAKECLCESTVLIVDDNFFNLIPLELILRETFGLNSDKALNGQEAVMKFANHNIQEKPCRCGVRYRLVLMDLNMPVMDGYEATQEIMRLHQMQMDQEMMKGNNGEGHKTAGSGESCHAIAGGSKKDSLFIVAVTAFVNEENVRHCYEAGMIDVIHKPVSVDSIRNILELYYFQRNVSIYPGQQ